MNPNTLNMLMELGPEGLKNVLDGYKLLASLTDTDRNLGIVCAYIKLHPGFDVNGRRYIFGIQINKGHCHHGKTHDSLPDDGKCPWLNFSDGETFCGDQYHLDTEDIIQTQFRGDGKKHADANPVEIIFSKVKDSFRTINEQNRELDVETKIEMALGTLIYDDLVHAVEFVDQFIRSTY